MRSFRPSGNAARNLGVYDTAEIEIRAGDRIRWTRNRRAPPARFGRARQPDIANGDQATVMEITPSSVRFRSEGGRIYSISRNDPQLRHIDHAYSVTVHAAQGLTSPRVIAVLEAGGRADQEMFYVELSRASDRFELVVDDRELLAERLEARPGIDEGALEAVGAGLIAPAVDPDLFARLQGDWRSIQRRADEGDSTPFHVNGYGETVAEIAALGIFDKSSISGLSDGLPPDMRDFVDGVMEEHDAHRTREDRIKDLAGKLNGHWRQWPELCWKASADGVEPVALEEYEQWKDEGDGARGRGPVAAVGRRGGRTPPVVHGTASAQGIEASLEKIEKIQSARELETVRARVGGACPRGGRDRRSRNPSVRLCRSGGTRRTAGGGRRTGRRSCAGSSRSGRIPSAPRPNSPPVFFHFRRKRERRLGRWRADAAVESGRDTRFAGRIPESRM